jgi:hypothetical protein
MLNAGTSFESKMGTNVDTAESGTGSRRVGDGERIRRERRQRSLKIVDEFQSLVARVDDDHHEVEVRHVSDCIRSFFNARRQQEEGSLRRIRKRLTESPGSAETAKAATTRVLRAVRRESKSMVVKSGLDRRRTG